MVICPEDIQLSPEYCTGVAFDNCNRFFESCSGKDTLHDAVGIIYQNTYKDISKAHTSDIESNVNEPPSKRRRTFDAICPELVTYLRKSKMVEKLLPISSELRLVDSIKYSFYEKLDAIWALTHYLKFTDTPMWVGFNSKIVVDESVKQKVSYLTPINASPTNNTVVYETMRQSRIIVKELQQPCIQVTCDLAIAKIAL